MTTTPTCDLCEEPVSYTGVGRPPRYCDRCRTRECEECGTVFTGWPTQRYCGQTCRRAAMAKRNRSDPKAQAERGRLGGKVRGAQIKALSQNKGYTKENGEHVHRVVAAAILGRDLLPGETVHHEDRDKRNNHPHNLVVFPNQAEHAKHHKMNHFGPCDCTGIRLKEVM